MTTAAASRSEFDFDIPKKRSDDTPRMNFTINGEPFSLIMPKLSIAVGLLTLLDRDRDIPFQQYGYELATTLWSLINYVEEEDPEPLSIPNPKHKPGDPETTDEILNPRAGELHGRAHLVARLKDPQDALDITDLAPILGRMLSVMFGRPTGSPVASLPRPAGNGRASGGRTRAKPRKKS